MRSKDLAKDPWPIGADVLAWRIGREPTDKKTVLEGGRGG